MKDSVNPEMIAAVEAVHESMEAHKEQNIRASLAEDLAAHIISRIKAVDKPRYYYLERTHVRSSGDQETVTDYIGKNSDIDLSPLTTPEDVVSTTARLVARMTTEKGTEDIGVQDLGSFGEAETVTRKLETAE